MTDQLLVALKDALDVMCDTCRIHNPQHSNCTGCNDTDPLRETIRKAQADKQWSDTFPTEEGWYWFLGQDYGRKYPNETICLSAIEVWRIANGYAYVCRGHFMYPSEAIGVWLPMTLPEFPKE